MPVTEVQTHIKRQIFVLTVSESCYGKLTRYIANHYGFGCSGIESMS